VGAEPVSGDAAVVVDAVVFTSRTKRFHRCAQTQVKARMAAAVLEGRMQPGIFEFDVPQLAVAAEHCSDSL
jgi:hypothetical protein